MSSLIFVATFGIPLTLFAIALALGSSWLSLLLPGAISTYIVLMLLLSAGAWLLLWVYLAIIARMKRGWR